MDNWRALIVANDEYEHEGLQRLLSPAADAAALAGVLGNRAISDFDVQVVRNEAAHIIQGRIEDLFLESRPDDVLLLHFSCHGLKSESGELFFAARNTRPNRLGSTTTPADFVQRCMRVSRSRSIVLLLDCCYGGAFSQGVTVRTSGDVNVLDSFPGGGLGGRGRAVITASSSMEYAFEGDQLATEHGPSPSVFTTALVEGLATGDADLDEDGRISLNELYEYIFDRVRRQNPHQTPSRDIEMQGELYLARSTRRRIRSLPIPSDLQEATTDPNMFTRLGAVNELSARLTSDNLPVAAGAHDMLTQMARTDIQYVAQAAAAALREATVHAVEDALHFGQVTKDSIPHHRTVRLLGPPLARACTFAASDPWIRLNETPEGVEVSINTEETGILRGHITIKGPIGEAVIPVDVEVTPGAGKKRPEPRDVDKTLGSDSAVRHKQRRELTRPLSGILAILAAILLIVGLFPKYEDSESLLEGSWELRWYVIGMAVLMFTAGGYTILPRTRQLIGPGILLGAAAASTWGLTYVADEQIRIHEIARFGAGSWLELGGHMILVLAACLAGFMLIRDPTVHLAPRLLRYTAAWMVIILGGVGAAALFIFYLALYNSSPEFLMWDAYPTAAVMAFMVPACAIVSVPRQFGLSLLAGWIGGGLSFFLSDFVSGYTYGVTRVPIIIFGGTLLLLAVAAGFLSLLSRAKVRE